MAARLTPNLYTTPRMCLLTKMQENDRLKAELTRLQAERQKDALEGQRALEDAADQIGQLTSDNLRLVEETHRWSAAVKALEAERDGTAAAKRFAALSELFTMVANDLSAAIEGEDCEAGTVRVWQYLTDGMLQLGIITN